jgi:hypothetical protein
VNLPLGVELTEVFLVNLLLGVELTEVLLVNLLLGVELTEVHVFCVNCRWRNFQDYHAWCTSIG